MEDVAIPMQLSLALASIYESEPKESGGRRSRGGYRYQDLCALRYCIASAMNSTWDEVWCESHDDIVLYRRDGDAERYRFVQVKFKFSASQHWSCSKLCALDDGKPAKNISQSVIAKLFERDQFSGECDFRLSTNEGVAEDLKPFVYRWRQQEPTVALTTPGALSLRDRLAEWSPPRAKKVDEYIERFRIEIHAADNDDMEAAIIRELGRFLASRGLNPLLDELNSTFRELYLIVYEAACSDSNLPGHPERLISSDFLSKAIESASRYSTRTDSVSAKGPSDLLETELQAANASNSTIELAKRLRLAYFAEWRRNSGTARGAILDSAFDDVQAICAFEMTRAKEVDNLSGGALLHAIHQRLEAHHASAGWQSQNITIGITYGMFYFLVGRGGVTLSV